MFIVAAHLSVPVFPTVLISCGFRLISNVLSIVSSLHESESSNENLILRIVFSDLHIFVKCHFFLQLLHIL